MDLDLDTRFFFCMLAPSHSSLYFDVLLHKPAKLQPSKDLSFLFSPHTIIIDFYRSNTDPTDPTPVPTLPFLPMSRSGFPWTVKSFASVKLSYSGIL